MHNRIGLFLLISMSLVLAACGGTNPSAPTPLPAVTLSPASAPIFVPGCTTEDLENWVEHIDFLLRDFVAAMNEAETQPPEEARRSVRRMEELRNAILAVPAPEECAAEAHTLIAGLMQTALEHFQAYANGTLTDLGPALEEINAVLGDTQTLQNQLGELLDAQFSAAGGEN